MMKPKEGTPNKAKIKSAGRMLKNAGFNVLGTLTKEEAHKDLTSPDRKGGYGYIEVSMVNNGWLGNPINLLELKKKKYGPVSGHRIVSSHYPLRIQVINL